MNNVRTVSDTKRSFYAHHVRPINSIYRRVVEELMVEMHLLSVNTDFVYDPLYALGVVTSFDRFMAGYLPEPDKDSIFIALCKAVEADPQQYRQDAAALLAAAQELSLEDLKARFEAAQPGDVLQTTLHAVAGNSKFKYSRLFAIGLYTLVETVDASVLEDKEQRDALLIWLAERLQISSDKAQKDLELYASNLEKMAQAQQVMKEIVEADRKQREQRLQAQEKSGTPDGEDATVDDATSKTEDA